MRPPGHFLVEGLHIRLLRIVHVGIRLGQPCRYQVEIRLRLLHGHAGLQPRNGLHAVMLGAIELLARVGGQANRHKDFGGIVQRKLKIRWHHAHQVVRAIIQRDYSAEHLRIASQALLPELVAH